MAITQTEQAELPHLNSFFRTPFGFYVADHKSPNNLTWPKTYEWVQRDGAILIPNTCWSRVATLTEQELEGIENTDIREETRRVQRLMLDYPAQFVNLITVGNSILIEPYGFGIRILKDRLETGHIEHYDHDASKIKLGQPQKKYMEAKLWVKETAKDDAVRFAARNGDWYADFRRFSVYLDFGPSAAKLQKSLLCNDNPNVAGLNGSERLGYLLFFYGQIICFSD